MKWRSRLDTMPKTPLASSFVLVLLRSCPAQALRATASRQCYMRSRRPLKEAEGRPRDAPVQRLLPPIGGLRPTPDQLCKVPLPMKESKVPHHSRSQGTHLRTCKYPAKATGILASDPCS